MTTLCKCNILHDKAGAPESETINVTVDMEQTEQPTATESGQAIPNTSQSITNSGQVINGLDSIVEDNTKC